MNHRNAPSLLAVALLLASCSGPANQAAGNTSGSSLAASGTSSASGLPAASRQPPATDIHFGALYNIGTAPVLIAVDNGVFAANSLNLSVEPFTDTVKIMVAVATGQLEMGQVAVGAAVFNAFNRGTDLQIIASAGQQPPGHGSNLPLVVRNDLFTSGVVQSVGQLKGHKVALAARATLGEYELIKALQAGGLKPGDIEPVYGVDIPGMVAGLETNRLTLP